MEHKLQREFPVGTRLLTERKPGSRFPVMHGEIVESLREGLRIEWDVFGYPLYYTWSDFQMARKHGVVVDSGLRVGDGGTYSVGSDRYPATVIKIVYFKHGSRKGEVYAVEVQTDWSTVTSGSESDGSARYEIKRDEFGAKRVFRATADGKLGKPGNRFTPGTRSRYYDPHV